MYYQRTRLLFVFIVSLLTGNDKGKARLYMSFPYSSYLKIPGHACPIVIQNMKTLETFLHTFHNVWQRYFSFSKYGFPTAKIGASGYRAIGCLFILTIKWKRAGILLPPHIFIYSIFNLFKLCVIRPSSLKSFYNKLLAREMFLFSQQNPTNKYIKIN